MTKKTKQNIPQKSRRSASGVPHASIATKAYARSAVSKSEMTSFQVRNRELVTSVSGTADYNCTSWVVNPGRSLFPWLSQFATCYDMWSIESLSFEYVPSCSVTSTGSVRMAIDYDVTDDIPVSESALSVYSGLVTGPYWESLTLAYRKSEDMLQRRYTTFAGDTNYDRTTDAGQLLIATIGGNGVLGQLWVSYSIRLYRPQVPTRRESVTVGSDPDLAVTVLNTPGPGVDSTIWPVFMSGGSPFRTALPNLPSVVEQLGKAFFSYDYLTSRLTFPRAVQQVLIEWVVKGITDSVLSISSQSPIAVGSDGVTSTMVGGGATGAQSGTNLLVTSGNSWASGSEGRLSNKVIARQLVPDSQGSWYILMNGAKSLMDTLTALSISFIITDITGQTVEL